MVYKLDLNKVVFKDSTETKNKVYGYMLRQCDLINANSVYVLGLQ